MKHHNTTHGHGKHNGKPTPTYTTWKQVIQRSHTGTATNSSEYLGKGINVCERWLKFENFLADMGERPLDKTLDRVDNEKGYSKENCRWATRKEQQRNRRYAVQITINGVTKDRATWAELNNIPLKTVKGRMRYGWDAVKAVTCPVDRRKSDIMKKVWEDLEK